MNAADLARIGATLEDIAIFCRLAEELVKDCQNGRPQRLAEIAALLRVLGPKSREVQREVENVLFAQRQTERVTSSANALRKGLS
jgi:hypothetical protein